MLLPLFACTKTPAADPAPVDPNAGKLVLALDGASDYKIVVPADGDEVLRETVNELQKYFYNVTGVTLPIIRDDTEATEHEIIIGKTTRSEGEQKIDRLYLGDEGFCIRTVGENIVIAGGGERGTLYGIYAFIEEYLGVRFWAEGEEYIPRTDTVIMEPLARDNIQKPGFEFRLQSHQTADSYTEKMHLNGAWSGDHQPIAGGIEYTGPWYVHTFGSLLGWSSRESYRKQPCLSDQKIFDKMFEAACKYIEQKPGATVISISQNDSTLSESGECRCDACMKEIEKYGSSGAMLRFVNRMANALKSKYPYIYVETLAYYYTQEPPKGGVTAAENVIVRFCNAGGCMLHSLTEEDPNSELFYPANNNKAYQSLLGWSEAADNLYIWDYNIDFGSVLTSIPNFKRLYDNITTYYELGVDGIYMQGMRDGGEFDRLRGYLTSKLLWNPRMTYEEYEALMMEFLNGYYGQSGTYVKQYIDYLADLCKDLHPAMYHDFSRFLPLDLKEDGTADRTHVDAMLGFYNAALDAADNYDVECRLRRTLLPILYYETLLVAKESANSDAPTDKLVALNQKIHSEMLRFDLKYLKEGISIPTYPNYRNTLLYWGWDGTYIYNEASATAWEKAKEEAKENEGKEEGETDEPIDVTKGQEDAEKNAA